MSREIIQDKDGTWLLPSIGWTCICCNDFIIKTCNDKSSLKWEGCNCKEPCACFDQKYQLQPLPVKMQCCARSKVRQTAGYNCLKCLTLLENHSQPCPTCKGKLQWVRRALKSGTAVDKTLQNAMISFLSKHFPNGIPDDEEEEAAGNSVHVFKEQQEEEDVGAAEQSRLANVAEPGEIREELLDQMPTQEDRAKWLQERADEQKNLDYARRLQERFGNDTLEELRKKKEQEKKDAETARRLSEQLNGKGNGSSSSSFSSVYSSSSSPSSSSSSSQVVNLASDDEENKEEEDNQTAVVVSRKRSRNSASSSSSNSSSSSIAIAPPPSSVASPSSSSTSSTSSSSTSSSTSTSPPSKTSSSPLMNQGFKKSINASSFVLPRTRPFKKQKTETSSTSQLPPLSPKTKSSELTWPKMFHYINVENDGDDRKDNEKTKTKSILSSIITNFQTAINTGKFKLMMDPNNGIIDACREMMEDPNRTTKIRDRCRKVVRLLQAHQSVLNNANTDSSSSSSSSKSSSSSNRKSSSNGGGGDSKKRKRERDNQNGSNTKRKKKQSKRNDNVNSPSPDSITEPIDLTDLTDDTPSSSASSSSTSSSTSSTLSSSTNHYLQDLQGIFPFLSVSILKGALIICKTKQIAVNVLVDVNEIKQEELSKRGNEPYWSCNRCSMLNKMAYIRCSSCNSLR